MNTSFLSAFPTAPPAQDNLQPQTARSGRSAPKSVAGAEDVQFDDSETTTDSDKADAFAEMLAAMMSIASPLTETPAETETQIATATATTATVDVPRDGAGSPLFTSGFSGLSGGVGQTTTGVQSGISLTETTAGQSSVTGESLTAASTTVALNDAAAAELETLGQSGTATPDLTLEPTLDASVESTVDGHPELVESNAVDLSVAEARTTSWNAAPDQATLAANETEAPSSAQLADRKSESLVTETPVEKGTVTSNEPAIPEASGEPVLELPVVISEPAVDPLAAPATEPAALPGEATAVANDFNSATEAFEEPTAEGIERPARPQTEQPRSPATSASRPATARPTMEPEFSSEPATIGVVDGVTAAATELTIEGSPPREYDAADTVDDVENVPAGAETNAVGAPTGGTELAATTAASTAATAVDSRSASTPAHVSQQVLQALAAYEAEVPVDGSRSFELLLDPPELGRLLIQMSRTAKGVDVRISAENESVRSILETTGQELQQNLQLSGFDLGQFSGSSSNGSSGSGEEFLFAPSLRSFAAAGSQPGQPTASVSRDSRAVNVVV